MGGSSQNIKIRRKVHHLAVSLLFLLVSASSQFRFLNAEGRKLQEITDSSKTVNEDKSFLRAQIGSRPPRCDHRCQSCTHCEAIQVPTNPQTKNGKKNSGSQVKSIEYARTDGNSNYKPMSWKCKCDDLIFNP